jgi:DNA-binding transcriptional LysR family regulator
VDRLVAMQAFVKVAETGSFTRASEALDVPKATVSRLVQALETQLQVRLLHRTTRALQLTAEGAAYFERTVRLLADLEDIESGARGSLASPAGTIRVDVSVAAGTMVIVPALSDFYARYPDIRIDLGIGNRDVQLVADNVDCAIRVGEIADQSLVARRIGEFAFLTCATPAYLEVHGTPMHPNDLLRGHETIGMVSSRLGRALPFVFVKGAERFELAPSHRLSVNDTNAYLVAGLSGLGIMQAPTFSLQAAIDAGTAVPILRDWNSDTYATSIVYPRNRFLSAKVRVFIDWAVELFDRNANLKRS